MNSVRIHNWSSIYAAHFLIEARFAGYDVDNNGVSDGMYIGNGDSNARTGRIFPSGNVTCHGYI